MRSPGSTAPEVGAYKHPAHHLRYKRRPLRLFVTNFVCAGVRSIAGTNKSRHRQSRSQFRGRVRSFFVGMRILRRRRGLASAEGRDSRRGAGRSQGEARAGPSWPEHDAAGHDARDAGLVKIRGGVLRAGGGGRGGAPSQKRGVCATTPPNVVVCAHERRHSPAWLLLLRTHSCTCAQWRARDGLSSDPQANYSKPGGKKDGGTSVETLFLYTAYMAFQIRKRDPGLETNARGAAGIGADAQRGRSALAAGARKAGWKEAGGERWATDSRTATGGVKILDPVTAGILTPPLDRRQVRVDNRANFGKRKCAELLVWMRKDIRENPSSLYRRNRTVASGSCGTWEAKQSRSKAKYGSVAELCSKAGSRPMAESLKGGIWLGGRIMLEGRITPNGGVAQRRNMAQRPMSCTKATTLEGGQLCSKATTLEGGQLCSKAESCTKATTLEGGHAALKQSYARRRIPD
ncbi:hypothetical protein GGX14DRAFT_385629 [Mycena pura]|uniref:Uncharacterized protein n=1 Tax=Mycena pura TaxID=153505 RepID=A0AAD6YRM9_9AGAR|nr:hypothetical protein GGX14DRAFT_385629 [Mycena pura]